MVSGNRAETSDHQKPLKPAKTEDVNLARLSFGEAAGRIYAECSCGWLAYHVRRKVVEDKAEAHVTKKHAGRAIWL